MKSLNEVSYEELANDKESKFFFHGLTDKKFSKIRKPTTHDPFFVTDKLSIAKSYATRDFVYILRLNDTRYFNFHKKSDLMKLFENNKTLVEAMEYIMDVDICLMTASESIAECLNDIYYDKNLMIEIRDKNAFKAIVEDFIHLDDEEDSKLDEKSPIWKFYYKHMDDFGLEKLKVSIWLLQFCREKFIQGKMKLDSSRYAYSDSDDDEYTQARRTVKKILFDLILKRTDYKIVGESDTSEDWVGELSEKIREFAILDLSAIKDVYPYPVKVKDVSKVLKQLKGKV